MRCFEIVRQIFKHRGLAACAAAKIEKTREGLRLRLRDISTGGDVENPVELLQNAELLRDPFSVPRRAIGEYELPAFEPRNRFAKLRRVRQGREVDIVDVSP